MIVFRNLGKLGRFGNQLFQIASTIGIAKRHNYDFAFPEWKNYDHLERFGSSEDIDVQKYFVNPLPTANDLERFPERWVNWGYHPGPYPDNISLNGHMQSDKYFSHCMNVVQHYFRMKDEPEQNDYCAIHYRAGDYIDDKNAYHPRCSKEYYEKAMGIMSDNGMKPVKWAVFTDDYYAWRKMFPDLDCFEMGNDMIATGSSYIQDFRFMKRCHSFITANSTFSLMAAILGEHPDKKIICPRNWFGLVAGITFDGMYPDKAIII